VDLPDFEDVLRAREVVARFLPRTPTWSYPSLSRELGCELFVKHENHQPVGAFKVRGGVNLIATLSADERRGVITATTGNHGQSIALACQREGVPCTIVVPLGNNPEKNAAMRAYGAELIEFGRDFDEARERVERIQHERGIIVRTIMRAQAWRAIVTPARSQCRRVKRVDLASARHGEGDMRPFTHTFIIADPEERLAVPSEAQCGAAGLGHVGCDGHQQLDAQRRQCRRIEAFRHLDIAHRKTDMINHGILPIPGGRPDGAFNDSV